MSDAKYTIVEKEFNGIEIDKLIIENNLGQRKKVKMSDMVKLARADKLNNARAILDIDTGEYILDVENGLGSLAESDRSNNLSLELTARIIEDNKCIGFKAVDSKGKAYKLTIDKIWILAEQGSVNGIIGKYIGDNKVLLSTDDKKLMDLPKLNV